MLENIKNNSIIICDNNYKIQILKNMNKIINIKFFSMDEFIKNLYFDYDEKSILYLIKNYNLKYEVAIEYLKLLICVEDKVYNIKKLDFLVQIKKELINNKLLIFNSTFKNYIKGKNIIIYKYNLNKFERFLLKDINYDIIENTYNNYIPTIYEFNDIYDEVEYVALEISKLIDKGVSINNIKLTNVSSEYLNVINKVFNFYNLKINKCNRIPIMSTVIGSTFYKNIDSGIDYSIKSINSFNNTDIYNKIINICNKYIWCDNNADLKILISHDLNNTYINRKKYTNEIEVIDFKNYDLTCEYVFMIGFNQGIIPVLKKDEDYINDDIKPNYLDNTVEINKMEKEIVIKSIKNIKNLIITYKLKTSFNIYYPSNLIEKLGSKVCKLDLDLHLSYSDLSNSIKLSKDLDRLIKFGEKSKNLSLLNSNYDIPYNTYSNNFTGINKNTLNKYINSLNEFNLSYSSMDNYNRCSFRFYVEKILCLKNNINKFSITLGNLYHHILEIAINNDIDILDEITKYLHDNNIILNKSEKFFIDRTIDNIKYLISVIRKQNTYSKLNTVETEKKIKVHIKDNINFIGYIDKIMYKHEQDSIISSIIDYKTYVKKPSLKYSKYGIGLQLPVYMYLAKNEFKNIRFIGFYMQNIQLDNKSIEEKIDSLKLIGYTNTDKSLLENFDYNYMDSSVISGIKVNNDGNFSSNSLKHMLDDEKINYLIDLINNKINETIDNVLNSKFDINPKFDKENIGCEFCNYRDLCFMNESNFMRITGSEE